VKEAQKEALKSVAKSLFGVDLLEVKIPRKKELGRELTEDEGDGPLRERVSSGRGQAPRG
jgi:hypothetical protein